LQGTSAVIVGTIHDEILVEAPDDRAPEGEHSVILTFPVAALGTVQTPDPVYRYTWHIAVLTCGYCSPHTTTHRSA
jgi:hypothetical protein